MNGSAVIAAEYIPMPGGISSRKTAVESRPKWHGIGVLYSCEENGVISFRVVYESHIPNEVKEKIAETFGAGVLEWQVCP